MASNAIKCSFRSQFALFRTSSLRFSSSKTLHQNASSFLQNRQCRLYTSNPPVGPAAGVSSNSSSIDFTALRSEMISRKPPLLYDTLTSQNSDRLDVSLSSFAPDSWAKRPSQRARNLLPPAHHLVYFNPAIAEKELLPDGTDPIQSPGEPFVRRMWAGGSLRFRTPVDGGKVIKNEDDLILDGRPAVCLEGIRDVSIKGNLGSEKVFVGIERRFGTLGTSTEKQYDRWSLQEKLWSEDENDFTDSVLIERRNIVFMRERSPGQAKEQVANATTKMLKAAHEPDFEHRLVPTPALLFRYSALTFNAHAIHLDPEFCKAIEGHRGLLVHGPLSLTLLVTMLEARISGSWGSDRASTGGNKEVIAEFDYRNLAPLYAGEEMRLCGRELGEKNGGRRYELWVEGLQGGVSVRGVARTVLV